jgi:hypothetical protein
VPSKSEAQRWHAGQIGEAGGQTAGELVVLHAEIESLTLRHECQTKRGAALRIDAARVDGEL